MAGFSRSYHFMITNYISLERWRKKYLIIALLSLCSIIIFWALREQLQQLIIMIGDREILAAYAQSYGRIGSYLMYAYLFLQVIIATMPGQAIMVTGGYLYGFWTGVLITYTSTVTASQLCYALARHYGRPIVKKLAPADIIDKWTARADRQGIPFFIFAFTTPIFPADVMNFVAGLSGLSGRKFMIANFIGRLPTAIVFTLIGSHGLDLPLNLMIAALIAFTILVLAFWRLVGKILEANI